MNRPAAHAIASPGRLKAWWTAARPPTLTIAMVPVLVGTALAWHAGAAMHWVAAGVALCAAVLIQIGTNLYNDVGDYERGADGADRLGPPRASSLGWLAPADVRRAAATSFGLAMVLGAYLVSIGGWPIFVIGIASVAAGIAYTGGPRPIAYTASGEFFVFVFFGLVATIGSYFLQAGRFSWASTAAGAMIGAFAAAVLVVNNYRDIESDRRSGKITLAVRIGYAATRVEFAALVLLPFAALPLLAVLTGTGLRMLLPCASLPIAAVLLRDLARAPVSPALNPLLKRTAGLEFVFGLLVCAALAL
ncbi:MAG TPA: 1,4-dihydroxy-2-naphthoate polyprenyltransferase [Burkholderiales bacterium]|nr:1,4-dihydroxy-2-naphthoate polyprenyltransferase [Burkholderiales bacterium]